MRSDAAGHAHINLRVPNIIRLALLPGLVVQVYCLRPGA
jgi:hypothetical protein